jgi:prefoldin subunit 5
MTSDEIREEFEAWASLRWPQRIEDWKKNKMCAWEACVQEAFEKAYLAAAEPREKRIAELEQRLAALRDVCNELIKIRGESQAIQDEKRIAELEQERDEWRHKYESLRSDIATVEARIAENEKCLGELSTFAEMDKQRIVELERERDEARVFGEKAAKLYNELLADQPVLTCAFCGQAYPPDTPATQHQALADHIAVCAKHPMRELEARLARLREAAKAVQKIADRNTDEFNALRAALAEEQEKPCPPSQS